MCKPKIRPFTWKSESGHKESLKNTEQFRFAPSIIYIPENMSYF